MNSRQTTLAYMERPVEHSYRFCYQCNELYDTAEENLQGILTCSDCHRHAHASCASLSDTTLELTRTYDWQCHDCKTCIACHSKKNKADMLICVSCDRSLHVTCNSGMRRIPKGNWYCEVCLNVPSLSSDESSLKHDPVLLPLSDNQGGTVKNTSKRGPRRIPAPRESIQEEIVKITTQGSRRTPKTKPVPALGSRSALLQPSGRTNQRQFTPNNQLLSNQGQANSCRTLTKRRKQRGDTATISKESSFTDSKCDQKDYFDTFGYQLTKEESNTVRGTPSQRDIDLFDFTRTHKKPNEQMHLPDVSLESDSMLGLQYTDITFPKTSKIQFGDHLIDIWFSASSYPEAYNQYPTLYICEYCLTYMKTAFIAKRHKVKCLLHRPPGKEIYRSGTISIFEVNGGKQKTYCQNLCLLAKLFLDHKILYLDVEPFLFYVMTEKNNDDGCQFVGYFSKENRPFVANNVSCILIMPNHQRKGYGQYLIEFSYLLSKREGLTGSPERPLSKLGFISYRSYWKDAIFCLLHHQTDPISIDDISLKTGMTTDDIVETLVQHGMISSRKPFFLNSTPFKAIPGYSTMTHRNTASSSLEYKLHADIGMINAHVDKMNKRQRPVVDPCKLIWVPYEREKD